MVARGPVPGTRGTPLHAYLAGEAQRTLGNWVRAEPLALAQAAAAVTELILGLLTFPVAFEDDAAAVIGPVLLSGTGHDQCPGRARYRDADAVLCCGAGHPVYQLAVALPVSTRFRGLSPPYATIVADPPWPSMHQRSTYHRGKPERHYPTMTVEAIAALPVGTLADVDAHLWIWGINRLLGAAYDVARAWGFEPVTLLTWCKQGPGMGYYLRNNTEHCLLATRGKPMVPAEAIESSWFTWPRGRHSQKPAASYQLIERVSPGPYLELFARRMWLGWDSWGAGIGSEPAGDAA